MFTNYTLESDHHVCSDGEREAGSGWTATPSPCPWSWSYHPNDRRMRVSPLHREIYSEHSSFDNFAASLFTCRGFIFVMSSLDLFHLIGILKVRLEMACFVFYCWRVWFAHSHLLYCIAKPSRPVEFFPKKLIKNSTLTELFSYCFKVNKILKL